MEVAVIAATVVAVLVVVVVLARQGSVGRLSEERRRGPASDRARRRPGADAATTGAEATPDDRSEVDERPAGPGAESMRTDRPGEPVVPPPDPEDRPS